MSIEKCDDVRGTLPAGGAVARHEAGRRAVRSRSSRATVRHDAARQALPDWDALTFSYSPTDLIYRCLGESGRDPAWGEGELLPAGPVELPPAAGLFSYGIGIFEGLKAHRGSDGRLLLFRHADNARRFARSAERLVMEPFPEDRFQDAVEDLVRSNARFVPPHGRGSLYVRPMQHGIEAQLGVRPSRRFWVLMFACPVGAYFAGRGSDPAGAGLRLRVLRQGRVAPGGTGSAKAIGNYASGLALAYRFKQQGFHDVLFLDARHLRYLTETSGSNVFVRLAGGTLVTPELDDQVLPGVTRDSVIRIAREILGLSVEERPVDIDEVMEYGEEVFCTGTAYTVSPVDELVTDSASRKFASREVQRALLDALLGIQRGDRDDPFGWVTEVGDGNPG